MVITIYVSLCAVIIAFQIVLLRKINLIIKQTKPKALLDPPPAEKKEPTFQKPGVYYLDKKHEEKVINRAGINVESWTYEDVQSEV